MDPEEVGNMTTIPSFPFYAVLQQRYSPEFLFGSESLYYIVKVTFCQKITPTSIFSAKVQNPMKCIFMLTTFRSSTCLARLLSKALMDLSDRKYSV